MHNILAIWAFHIILYNKKNYAYTFFFLKDRITHIPLENSYLRIYTFACI